MSNIPSPQCGILQLGTVFNRIWDAADHPLISTNASTEILCQYILLHSTLAMLMCEAGILRVINFRRRMTAEVITARRGDGDATGSPG